jgi:hypothetical protein
MNKDLMRQAGFGEHVDAVECGFCPFCKNPISITEFKNAISKREYHISGLCQKCQDETFG